MKNRPGVLRASLNVMRAAVVAAGAALPCLPFLLRGAVSAMRQGFWLRLYKTKCGVCDCAFTRKSTFRFHLQMRWTCSECWNDLMRAERGIHRANLSHLGVEPPSEDVA